MIKPRILIVDDEKQVREGLADFLLKRLDCEAVICPNGEAAVEALSAGEFHVLIQDLHMPGISGFDVIDQAKKKYAGIIILVITKWDDPAYTRMIEAAGAIYVPKPLALKAVLRILESELQKR
ncbi:MAG: response regulator [Candidatus Omnitrophica bacterium]|nr:response regulator [Candidatus Omnitrophota bacterium]